jgi:mandelate racemase
MHPLSDLTLHSVTVRAVSVPLRRPIVAKVGTYAEWPILLIDLHTHEGVVGRAYLEPYLQSSLRYLAGTIQDLAQRLKGKPLAPFDMQRDGMGALHLLGRQGMSQIAIAGLDMAIWDARARAANVPLAVLLGGTTGTVRAYNTNGLWLVPLEKIEAEAIALVAEGGFDALKLRLGRANLKEDLAVIAAVRRGVGDHIKLMVDFNQGLALGEALLRLHALDDQGLYWLEEPLVYDNYEGHAQLARELRTPLQLGENIYGPREFYKAVAAKAADLYMPDLMRIGGVSGWLRTAAIAGAAGIPLSSHLYPAVSAQLLRVSETADWLEWSDWASPILSQPLGVKDGLATVPDGAGSGIDWNEDAIKHFAL